MIRTPEQRLERAKVLYLASVVAVEQAAEIAAAAAIEWAEYLDEDAADGPCGQLIDAGEFGLRLSRALDPLLVLPEPADTAADAVAAVIGFAIAAICSQRRSDPKLRDAAYIAKAVVKHARWRQDIVAGRVARLENVVARRASEIAAEAPKPKRKRKRKSRAKPKA